MSRTMLDLTEITIVGTIQNNPDLVYYQPQKANVTFQLLSKDILFDIRIDNSMAEYINKYYGIGDKIYIEGRFYVFDGAMTIHVRTIHKVQED